MTGQPRTDDRQGAQHERRIGADHRTPPVQALTSGQPHEQDVHQSGEHNTRDPCDQGETGTAGIPERSVGELLTHLQADQEEEDDHQAVVDPVMQVHVQAQRPEVKPDVQVPQLEIGIG